jgi:hypothetical protein
VQQALRITAAVGRSVVVLLGRESYRWRYLNAVSLFEDGVSLRRLAVCQYVLPFVVLTQVLVYVFRVHAELV